MSVTLDTRVIRITRWLLAQSGPRSTADLAADLGLTQRVVRYRLGHIERYLRTCDAELVRKRGLGLVIEASPATRAQIIEALGSVSRPPRVYAPEERLRILLAAMLWAAPAGTSLDELHLELAVSKTSARRDLRACEPWLERNGLPLVRRPGHGVSVVGTERRVRQAIVQLILEAIPSEVLRLQLLDDPSARQQAAARVPVGLRERFFNLPLAETLAIVRASTLGRTLTSDHSDTVFALFLAVSAARIREGHTVTVETGLHRSVMDHPIAQSVAGIVPSLEELAGTSVAAEEVAAVTEYLLGLDALDAAKPESSAIGSELLDEVMGIAGAQLHSALTDDTELRNGLSSHLERLSVRVRYGLPIHNPLLREVRQRYPEVHAVAAEMAKPVEAAMAVPIAEDEIGFITMYVCGAMERARLRPRRRALVVCPSGMATAWVLVSRIQAEFPQLDLVEVLSERGYEELPHDDFDLVISTVPVVDRRVPVVVVNPLLSAGDVVRVAQQV
ncbi:BglG family transcription antiterminator [Candidatus Poriferisodalis sp.]|uniref:BglG family transcription antiterminator n=1 Tax=Candidatus Poriferisodalis sp. TaxID=3101277 RepID=UPI003B025FBC